MSTESDDKEGQRLVKKLKDELAKPGKPVQVSQPDKWADYDPNHGRPADSHDKTDDSSKKP